MIANSKDDAVNSVVYMILKSAQWVDRDILPNYIEEELQEWARKFEEEAMDAPIREEVAEYIRFELENGTYLQLMSVKEFSENLYQFFEYSQANDYLPTPESLYTLICEILPSIDVLE